MFRLKTTATVMCMMACGVFVSMASTVSSDADSGKVIAQQDDSETAVEGVPERAIILSGNKTRIHDKVMTVLYDTNDLHFHDPSVPRFLFIDREGNTALGIGGYVEGVFMEDFRGSIDNNGFVTSMIPVPGSPVTRSRMAFDMSHSTIFLKLVRNTSLGVLNAYVQTEFSGDNGGYGLRLKMGYVSWGNVTVGLARSTFVDASADAPTIDYQGPSGAIGGERVLLRYRRAFNNHWVVAIGAEMPKLTETTVDGQSMSISQRVPDIPAYIQYCWGGGKSHVRATAMIRDLAYRDLVAGKNRYATGYGVQLSGVADFGNRVDVYYQAAYGKGIGSFVNDLAGGGYDLIPSSVPGKLKTPSSLSVEGGVKVNILDNLFVSGTYSINRLYDQELMGGDAYRRASYYLANAFYSPISDLMIGVEYIHGSRTDMNRHSGSANRLQAMLKYSF